MSTNNTTLNCRGTFLRRKSSNAVPIYYSANEYSESEREEDESPDWTDKARGLSVNCFSTKCGSAYSNDK